MRGRNGLTDACVFFSTLQWALVGAAYLYSKWGLVGGVIGFFVSIGLVPFAPLVFWYAAPPEQSVWYYGMLAIGATAYAVTHWSNLRKARREFSD